ncbi:MAG TPA: hypothetical protein VD999_07275 [Vitreimonas sp.]|nr:hypothetical protein [Vitreimonas sp.]
MPKQKPRKHKKDRSHKSAARTQKLQRTVMAARGNTSSLASALQQSATQSSVRSVSSSQRMSIVQLGAMFAVLLVANMMVIYLSHLVFPGNVVLGTHRFSLFEALLYSQVVLTFMIVGAVPVIELIAEQMRYKLQDMHWMLLYFFLNIGAVWVVARFAEVLGMGISSWMVAVGLAFILNIVQGGLVTGVISKVK